MNFIECTCRTIVLLTIVVYLYSFKCTQYYATLCSHSFPDVTNIGPYDHSDCETESTPRAPQIRSKLCPCRLAATAEVRIIDGRPQQVNAGAELELSGDLDPRVDQVVRHPLPFTTFRSVSFPATNTSEVVTYSVRWTPRVTLMCLYSTF